ncbi:MAG: hypothetical protein AAGM84_05980 [Pseudomonadota bacterium]
MVGFIMVVGAAAAYAEHRKWLKPRRLTAKQDRAQTKLAWCIILLLCLWAMTGCTAAGGDA